MVFKTMVYNRHVCKGFGLIPLNWQEPRIKSYAKRETQG